jgi:hypothetical protein
MDTVEPPAAGMRLNVTVPLTNGAQAVAVGVTHTAGKSSEGNVTTWVTALAAGIGRRYTVALVKLDVLSRQPTAFVVAERHERSSCDGSTTLSSCETLPGVGWRWNPPSTIATCEPLPR